MASSVASADGVRIAYEVHGAGTPALVLVHGWSCDRTYWSEQLRSLSARFRVVAVDLAGHGESGLGRDRWTIPAFGSDVAAVVSALDLDRAILVGHSMGGDVILEAARRLAGRIVGLIWVDTYRELASFRTPEEVEQRIAPFRANFVDATQALVRGMFAATADRALVERVAADMSSAPPAIALGALQSAWSFGREVPGLLRALNLPLVAINPDDPPSDPESMERHGATIVSMPRVGHFPMLEDPVAFNAALMEVAGRLAAGRSL